VYNNVHMFSAYIRMISSRFSAPYFIFYLFIYLLELKPIVVAIQWALVRTYWINEPRDW